MQLNEWVEKGVDVSAFTTFPLFQDKSTGILHSDLGCEEYRDALSAKPSIVYAAVDVELCDLCWDLSLPLAADLVDDHILDMKVVENEYAAARRSGMTKEGFSLLLEALYKLSDGPEVALWASRLRGVMLSEFEAALSADLPVEKETFRAVTLSESLGGRSLSGRSGMLFVPGVVVYSAFRHLNESDLRLAALWWDPASPWPGFVAEGPLELVEHLGAALADRIASELVSVVELFSDDTPAVLETALAFFDLDDPLFQMVDRAFAAARAV